jgi:hypothetical protein
MPSGLSVVDRLPGVSAERVRLADKRRFAARIAPPRQNIFF